MKSIPRIILITILSLFLLISCWEFLSIDQPEFADRNSTFDVPITVALKEEEGSGRGYFGIRLPQGWVVEDSISFQGVLSGTFIYSSDYSDSLESYEQSPDGYYWWVGVSDTVDSLPKGNINFTPQFTTDDQSGTFFIDYMISDRIDGFNVDWVVHGGPYPISVDAPVSITVTNTNDSGDGSLRQALFDISIGGEITFDLSYPAKIELNKQLVINRSVTISGPESGELIISGNDQCRVFEIKEHLNVNLSNFIISNGYAAENDGYNTGGGILSSNSNLNLENISIINNRVNYGDGGGLFLGDGSDVSLRNTKIIGNNAISGGQYYEEGEGGGIYCSNSSLRFYNVTISNNSASHYGGGIFINDSSNILFDSEYRSNIYLNNAQIGNDLYRENTPIVNVVLDTFSVLHPTSYYAFHPRNFTFDILNGKVTQYDSDLYISVEGDNNNSGISPDDAIKTIECAFSRIRTDILNPRIIYLAEGTYSPSTNGERFPLRLPDYTSLHGTSREKVILNAESMASVIQISIGTLSSGPILERCKQSNSIENVTITGGVAGGIHSWQSHLNLDSVIITDNSSNNGILSFGGGITSKNSILTLTDVIVTNNTTEHNGGGILCIGSESKITSTLIENNSAGNLSGGLYGGNGSTINVLNTRITKNSARNGGGIRCSDSHFNLAGVTIAYNSSSYEYGESAGGIHFGGGTFYFDENNLCNIFLNESISGQGKDIIAGLPNYIININVDTFTVLNPTEEYASPLERFHFDILHDASTIVDINKETFNITSEFSLSQNYPNPFNPSTTIEFTLPKSEFVELKIYNILGKEVTTLVSNKLNQGKHTYTFDGKNLSSGIYYYQLTAGDYREVKKMILLR